MTHRGAPRFELTDRGIAIVRYPALRREGEGELHAIATATASAEALTGFGINFFSTSASIAAKLSLGTIFDLNASASKQAVFWDSTAYTDYYEEATTSTGEATYAVRHGVGIRLALAVSNLKAGLSLSIASIAAQAELSMASCQYELQAVGLAPSLLLGIIGGLPVTGPLTLDSFKDIHRVLTSDLPAYLDDASKPLTPAEYIVAPAVPTPVVALDRDRIIARAAQRLALGQSFSDCLTALKVTDRNDERAAIASFVYAQFGAPADPDSQALPPQSAVTNARAWLQS